MVAGRPSHRDRIGRPDRTALVGDHARRTRGHRRPPGQGDVGGVVRGRYATAYGVRRRDRAGVAGEPGLRPAGSAGAWTGFPHPGRGGTATAPAAAQPGGRSVALLDRTVFGVHEVVV